MLKVLELCARTFDALCSVGYELLLSRRVPSALLAGCTRSQRSIRIAQRLQEESFRLRSPYLCVVYSSGRSVKSPLQNCDKLRDFSKQFTQFSGLARVNSIGVCCSSIQERSSSSTTSFRKFPGDFPSIRIPVYNGNPAKTLLFI